ncbi:putative leucine-rich repeat-containing protein DDB_G0290503 isoform X2 [Montipora foliosa]|uniref:putative leucine-rich repeat-containing protein DDB_G0290503 isoform X2 n=1 Tax=Montipora foliosa TaxID=591990 RepID=UPI0035F1ED17
MDADVSLHSADSICSDDTEYLLGQNVSIREIDEEDLQNNRSPQHSPPKLHQINVRSPSRKDIKGKPEEASHEIQRSPGQFNTTRSPVVEPSHAKAKAKSEKKSKVLHNYYLHNGVSKPKHTEQVKGQVLHETNSMKYEQDFEKMSKRKTTVKENYTKQRKTQSFHSPENHKVNYTHTQSLGKVNRSPNVQKTELYYDPRSQAGQNTKGRNRVKRKPIPSTLSPVQHMLPSNQDNWEIDSEISLDMVNGGQRNVGVESNDLESEMSEATEDLIREEDIEEVDDEDITEKLKELNLAVNYDAGTNEYFDDKVREGAELLSKLFGGQVDNYYSSSRQPLWIFQDSGQSKSSVSGSGSVQEVSRSDGQVQEKRNLSNTISSTTQKVFQKSLSPQLRPRTSEQNSATDQSSSFESSVSTSGRQSGSASHKEVRFRDDFVPSRAVQQRNYHLETDGEFIMETSAFRAAMNYDNDHDDDNDDDNRDNFVEQRKYQTENDVDEVAYTHTRQQTSQLGAEIGRKTGPSIKLQSPSKQRAPCHDESYSTHKDRSDQRFQIDEHAPVKGGFMTSTPQTKSQAIFSPQKADMFIVQREAHQKILLKLQESETKLNKSLQEVKSVEFELEEATSRKKIALQEIQVLEETVKRNKAEVKSSENLVEQYRQQATKTRSQLMDLEVQRNNIQHEIKELKNCLSREKLEAQQVVEVEKKNELKVLELSIEKDQLRSEMELLRSQLKQAEGNLANEKQNYLHKIGLLQEQLHEEQKEAKHCVEKLKQQLEDERQKARDSHYERINAIHKLQDESKEMHDKELEVLKNRLLREKEMELGSEREKAGREVEELGKKLLNRDHIVTQLESNIKDYEDQITSLKTQVVQQQQKLFDIEREWKDIVAKQETRAKAMKMEIDSHNQKEASLHEKHRRTRELLEEKELELGRLGEKYSSQSGELSQIIKDKDDEIAMLRGLVRQQEDATRLLGEKLRNEAQEHIRNALEKERETTDRERARHQAKLEEIRDKYESTLKQLREELESERKGHTHLNASVHKIKKEIEKLREMNLQAEREKVNAVANVRNEAKVEIDKMRDKIQELSVLAETSEKETAMEINEECRKTAALLGDSSSTTPKRNLSGSFVGESPMSSTASPAREALLNLRSYNEELRQHLIAARKELEQDNRELALKKPQISGDLTPQQVQIFTKALTAKEEELARIKRQFQEEKERNALQIKSERTAFKKTIERLERELKQVKAATPTGSPMVNGHSSPSESGVGTSLSSTTPSPRPGEDNSTARLLRHLQGRVQQLRAQNDSLRKSSENESLNDSHCSMVSTESFNASGEEETRRLQSALKMSEDKAQRNAAMLSQKMMEMTKLQKMLTHATKENMKLERAYASLQRKIIDDSR